MSICLPSTTPQTYSHKHHTHHTLTSTGRSRELRHPCAGHDDNLPLLSFFLSCFCFFFFFFCSGGQRTVQAACSFAAPWLLSGVSRASGVRLLIERCCFASQQTTQKQSKKSKEDEKNLPTNNTQHTKHTHKTKPSQSVMRHDSQKKRTFEPSKRTRQNDMRMCFKTYVQIGQVAFFGTGPTVCACLCLTCLARLKQQLRPSVTHATRAGVLFGPGVQSLVCVPRPPILSPLLSLFWDGLIHFFLSLSEANKRTSKTNNGSKNRTNVGGQRQ